MNWYQRIIESERFGPSPYRDNYCSFYTGPKRKLLYTDNFSSVVNELEKSFEIIKEVKDIGLEYRLVVNKILTVDYIVDCRRSVQCGTGYIEEQVIVIRLIEIKDDSKRGEGLGTKFIQSLLKTSERLYPHLCYVVFPYMSATDEEHNVRIGKWYINSFGFVPLRGSIEFVEKPHIRMGMKDTYDSGIRPLGWAADWKRQGGLGSFVAKEEEYTPVQKRYFHESKPL